MKKASRWYSFYRALVGLFVARAKFVYLGEKVNEPSIILSNHEAAAGPLTWEFNFKKPRIFWATHQMTENVRSVFRYLAYYYFPCKKHIPKVVSVPLGFIASPFVRLFFKGLNTVPVYDEAVKYVRTVGESQNAIEVGENVIVFPEDSSAGYFKRIGKVFPGFVVLLERLFRKGRDLHVYAAYYSKKKRAVIVDAPVRYSALRKRYSDRNAIAEAMRVRINELADRIESA